MKPIKREMDFGLITALMKGEMVVLCGENDEPSIELTMDPEEICHHIDDACDKLESQWEW